MKRRLILCIAVSAAVAGCGKGNSSTPTCGNGTLDPGEACDGTNLGGRSCITEHFLTGVLGCNADCALNTTACVARPSCGNGVIDNAEACDGTNLGGRTCQSEGFASGQLACTAACAIETSGCGGQLSCGNGQIDQGEDCDGSNLDGKTCADLGHVAGDLSCADDCSFNTSLCTGHATCGNNVAEGAEACDGTDLKAQTCRTKGFADGTLKCAGDCAAFDTSSCTGAGACGNNLAEGNEICDGTDLKGETCVTRGFAGGALGCAANCLAFVTTECTGLAACGNAAIDPGEVCDGTNFNGKTCQTEGYTTGTLACAADCRALQTSGCTGERCGVATSLGSPTPATSRAEERVDDNAVLGEFALNSQPDRVLVQLYPGAGVMTSGISVGTYSLAGAELNFDSCGLCVWMRDNLNKEYMATGGTVTLTSVSGHLTGTLTGVTFEEVTIDWPQTGGGTYHSTKVPGGCTSTMTSMAFNASIATWTCDSDAYGDWFCDCGCGVLDADCYDSNASSCDNCNSTGSCGNATCSNINATNNAVCGP